MTARHKDAFDLTSNCETLYPPSLKSKCQPFDISSNPCSLPGRSRPFHEGWLGCGLQVGLDF
jgi:hypothetical protein